MEWNGVLSAGFVVAAIFLALMFGAQAEAWSWGPAMGVLALAVLAGVITVIRGKVPVAGSRWVVIPLMMAAAWIALRIAISPVFGLARADGMLLLAMLGCAWVGMGIGIRGKAVEILHVGLSLTLVGNAAMALVQWLDPSFSWPYPERPSDQPTGFFGHYNYLSNYVIGVGALLLARACLGRDHRIFRMVYAVGFLAAVICVSLSGSRGGLIALGCSLLLFLVGWTLIGWRRRSRWFPAFAVAVPLVVIAGGAVGWSMLKQNQEERSQVGKITALADNEARLRWAGLALEVSKDHPWLGGGSRSFSWERNRKWKLDEHGYGSENERFVHNEFLQVVTDFGWIGGGLVLSACGFLLWIPFKGMILGGESDEKDRDAVHLGVFAAVGGMLLQANVSFVFHLLPSVMTLGLLFGLGAAAAGRPRGGNCRAVARVTSGVALSVLLGVFGWWSSQTLIRIWPVFYRSSPLVSSDPRMAFETLAVSSGSWGGFRIMEERGHLARELAARLSGEQAARWNELAAESYRNAAGSHPYHAGLATNLGNTLSELGHVEEASREFGRALELQGGLEAGFRARYYYAVHLYGSWHERWMKNRRSSEALWAFEKAAELLDEARSLTPGQVRAKEIDPLARGIQESIRFLRGAGVEPVEPDDL